MTTFIHQSCEEAYVEIMNRLGNKTDQLSPEFKMGLDNLQTAGSKYLIYKSVMNVQNIPADIMKQVIGRNGYYFILTTTLCDLDFIWHNVETQQIELWGPSEENLHNGMRELNKRFHKKMTM
jgi:hypothetical protein